MHVPEQTGLLSSAAEGGASRGELFLASQSPRRQQILRDAGFAFSVVLPPMDDAHLMPGKTDARQWATALAYLKAHACEQVLQAQGKSGYVLSADTVAIKNDRIVSKPVDAEDARGMLRAFSNAEHLVITGVAILPVGRACARERLLLSDVAKVRFGELSAERIEAHIASGAWRDKAGGYNIADQLRYDWPITCEGDMTTVMGLPIVKLTPTLRRLLAVREPTPVVTAAPSNDRLVRLFGEDHGRA